MFCLTVFANQNAVCTFMNPHFAGLVRGDKRCGPMFKNEHGTDGQCDPLSSDHCCAVFGECGGTPDHCQASQQWHAYFKSQSKLTSLYSTVPRPRVPGLPEAWAMGRRWWSDVYQGRANRGQWFTQHARTCRHLHFGISSRGYDKVHFEHFVNKWQIGYCDYNKTSSNCWEI